MHIFGVIRTISSDLPHTPIYKQAQPAAKTTPNTNRVFDPYKREDSNSCSTSGGAPGPDSCSELLDVYVLYICHDHTAHIHI